MRSILTVFVGTLLFAPIAPQSDDLERLAQLERAAASKSTDPRVWYALGQAYNAVKQDALRTFDRSIAAYPDGDWRTNSLFWSAKILDRAGRTAERDAKARQIVEE